MLSTLHRSFVSLLLFLFSSLSNWTFADPQQHIQNIHSLKGSRKFLVRNCTFIQLLRHKFFFDLNFLFHAIFFLVYFFLYSFIVLFIQKFIPFFLLFFISSIFLLLLFNIFSFSAFKKLQGDASVWLFFHSLLFAC